MAATDERDLQPRAAADLARRRRHRSPLLLPRARRLPRLRGDRQVRLHAHPHGLPAPLPDEVLRARGGRRDQSDPPPDPAREPAASLARQPAGDRLGGRRARGHRHGLLRRLHRLPAQGPRARAAAPRSRPGDLAEAACEIEIDVLGEPVGKQDPYVAAHGGICAYTFHPDGEVEVEPLELAPDSARRLRDQLLLFYTGEARSASTVLADQDERSKAGDRRDDREPPPHQGAGRREPPAARRRATWRATPS